MMDEIVRTQERGTSIGVRSLRESGDGLPSKDNEPGTGIDTFIQDIHYILKDINETQDKKRAEIKDHFKNIASNPEHSYSPKEQVAILLEIMKCYNKNIVEYQKNMRELGIITKNLIKAHNSSSFSDENHTSNDPQLSLYDYFIQLIWGKPSAVEPGQEPAVDLANIFGSNENDIIEHNLAQTASEILGTSNPTPNNVLAKKTGKRRNTIQPIIKHIPQM
jgi:hypothetical protein